MASLAKSFPKLPAQPSQAPTKALNLVPQASPKRQTLADEPIAAAKAKAHFLQLLDRVERDRTPITITKRGRIVAQLVPVAPAKHPSAFESMLGRTKGWMTITGDIVSPDHESWGSEWQ
jgi:prevent-host-death family protein